VYVGDHAQGDGLGVHVAKSLEDGEHLLPADAEGLVELSARLEQVGERAHGVGLI
jgi:hypothetical protein